MSPWRLAILLMMPVAYAGFSHWTMLFHAAAPWALGLLLGPLWLGALGLATRRFGAIGAVAAVAMGGALLALALRGEVGDPSRLYVFQHAGIHALLGVWFGGSLRRGTSASLIGQLAQRVHAMTPAMWTYSAQVTRLWTAFFALMACASVAVYLLAPFSAWSLLANVLTPALVAALFLGEHFMRYRLHPEFERVRVVDVVRAFRTLRPGGDEALR